MASVTFKRGTRAEIEATAKQDGQILMETDQTNNKMYVDLQNNNRVRIGNSNVDDISGITDSLTATSSNIALSAAGGNNLQGQIDTLNSNLINLTSLSGTKKKIGEINGFDLFEKTIIVASALNNWQNYAVNETVDHFLWIDVSQSFFEYNSEHLPICYNIEGYEVLLKTLGNSTIQSYLGTSYTGGVGKLTITVRWY